MIVDFHTHIFPKAFHDRREEYLGRDRAFGELYASPRAKMATAEDLLRVMDEDDVDRSVVMGIGWTDYALAREANDYIIESVIKYPGRLVGLGGVNPAWGDRAVQEAERCARAGLRGIGELHPDSQSFDLGDGRTMAPLMEVVKEHGLIVTTHSSEPVGHSYSGKGETRPEVLWRFIQNFPDATIVCAHWGGRPPVLRADAGGRRRARQRLLRYRGVALSVHSVGVFCGRLTGGSGPGPAGERLPPDAPRPSPTTD